MDQYGATSPLTALVPDLNGVGACAVAVGQVGGVRVRAGSRRHPRLGARSMCAVRGLGGTRPDPDDAFSSVPYEKGFALLFYLEQLVGGRDAFVPYLRAHVERFQHRSITTEVRVRRPRRA